MRWRKSAGGKKELKRRKREERGQGEKESEEG